MNMQTKIPMRNYVLSIMPLDHQKKYIEAKLGMKVHSLEFITLEPEHQGKHRRTMVRFHVDEGGKLVSYSISAKRGAWNNLGSDGVKHDHES